MDNPSQATCPFCKAKPSQVNLGEDFVLEQEEAFMELCLSILHFSINMFNHFLKVGAKIKANVKEHPAVGPVKQAKIKLASERIKKQFDENLGLQIQKKKMADGNMSRTAFRNIDFFSQTVGISRDLLWRFNVIRIALASCIKKGCDTNVFFFLLKALKTFPKCLTLSRC